MPDATPKTSPPRSLPAKGEFFTEGLSEYASTKTLSTHATEEHIRHLLKRTISASPAFNCLSREYAARFGADGYDPPPSTVYALANHCGYWTKPARQYSVTTKDLASMDRHLLALSDDITQGLKGVGAVRHPDGRVTVSILTPDETLRFKSFSRRGHVRIQGQFQRGDGVIEFWRQNNANTHATPLKVKLTPTGNFSLNPKLTAGTRLEVVRRQGHFRNTIALFEFQDRPSKTYTYFEEPTNLPSAKTELLDLLNRFRRKNGLRELVLEKHLSSPLNHWLTQVARGKASDVPPGILDPRGWPYVEMKYGITTGFSAREAFYILKTSPTGHALLTNSDVERTAIGLLEYRTGRGFDAVILGLKRFEPIPLEKAQRLVLERINEARGHQKLGQLILNTDLCSVAQDAADSVRSNQLQWSQAVKHLLGTVASKRLAQGQFGAGGDSTPQLKSMVFKGDPTALAPSMTQIGIGVASGPVNGVPRSIVIYVVAEKPALKTP